MPQAAPLSALAGHEGVHLPPGVHAEGSCREFVLRAATPPKSWIRLPLFSPPSSGRGNPWGFGCSTPAATPSRPGQRSRSLPRARSS